MSTFCGPRGLVAQNEMDTPDRVAQRKGSGRANLVRADCTYAYSWSNGPCFNAPACFNTCDTCHADGHFVEHRKAMKTKGQGMMEQKGLRRDKTCGFIVWKIGEKMSDLFLLLLFAPSFFIKYPRVDSPGWARRRITLPYTCAATNRRQVYSDRVCTSP